MRKKSVVRRSTLSFEPEKTARRFKVLVVIRHTRAGDERRAVLDNKSNRSVIAAMNMAQDIAQEAANMYGQGSASVFRGTLALTGEPITEEELEALLKAEVK